MELPSFRLVEWFAAAEDRFDISLSHSDCEPLSISDVLNEDSLNKLANHRLGYGTFNGLDRLRETIANQYSTLHKRDVLTFNGASEAIYTFMRTNLNPGDEVVIQNPIFNSLRGTAQAIGCKLVDWQPTNEILCTYDVSALDDLCNDQTKLIVFNFPHNPTGQMISEEELRSIVEIAKRYNAMIFSDEQFRFLELPETLVLSAACDLYDKAVSVTSVSKTCGMGGLRIGWLATRCRDVIERAKEYRYYTTEMTNTPCQMLAVEALKRSDEILTRNRNRISGNVQALHEFCSQHREQLELYSPKAGTMAVVEQKTPLTSTQFCERLLDHQKVFLVPGECMGLSDRLLRFGFGRDDFGVGLRRLGAFLERQMVEADNG